MNAFRSLLPALLASTVLTACPDASSQGATDPRPLDPCLVTFWRSPVGNCTIMPECTGSPTGDMAIACAAADCASIAFTGYRAGGSMVWGIGTWSATSRIFCSTDVASGSWAVTDAGHISVQSGATPAEIVPAVCLGTTATVNDATVTALPVAVATALEGRAAAGAWTPCGY